MNKKQKTIINNVIILFAISLLILLLFSNRSLSHTEIKYKKILISSGDTLWSLAKYEKNNNLYFANNDIRDIIEIIKLENNLKSCELKIGDELKIPTI